MAALYSISRADAGAGRRAWAAGKEQSFCLLPGLGRGSSRRQRFNGMGVPESTGTAVTLFLGEPSISLSEYVM